MKSFVRISSLLWADILVLYAMFVMQNYLTDVWKISYTNAAGILNFWNGISMMLPVFFLYLVDQFLGNFIMLVISSISYSVGIGLVAMSTPPVLGACSEYEPQCIGHTQKVIFYIGMALIAVGMAGHAISLRPYLEDQQEISDDNQPRLLWVKLPGFILVVVIPIIAAIALPYIKPWSLRFGIPAICTVFSTLLFLSGWIWSPYSKKMPEGRGSPVTNICRVFVAFAFKSFKSVPLDSKKLHRVHDQEAFTHTRFLRCLEKAAIIMPGELGPDNQVISKWKLCSVSQVEEAKIAVRMVPMWLTFIVCGIISSIGNTYFIEQANHMNRKIGKWNVPLPALLLLSDWAKTFCEGQAEKLLEKHKTHGPPVGIGFAMILSVLCCITAAKIETKRLNVIMKNGLLDEPDEDIPMSIYWLLFQFFLLAGLVSFFEKSVAAFYSYQAPSSMTNYLEHLTRAVYGLGFMFSALSVYIVGKVSKRGGKTNWFQFTLSRSRLDRYYWVLAALSSVNLVVFVVVASFYRYKNIGANVGVIEVEAGAVEAAPEEDKEEEEETEAR